MALAVILGLLAAVHVPFAIWTAYGSDDAAWDGIVIMLWAQHDRLPIETGLFVQERFRSSPLPAYLLKLSLDAGLLAFTSLPLAMNAAAVLAGLLVPGLLFVVWRRLASDVEAAIAVLLVLVSPEFFTLKFDGLPTLPAVALFLAALWVLVASIQNVRGRSLLVAAFAVLVVLAVLTKVDVVLLSPAVVVIAWMTTSGAARWRAVAWSLAAPLAALVVWHLFCRLVAPEAPSSGDALARWSEKWGIVPSGLLDPDNLRAMLMAPGVGTALALLPAVAWCFAGRERRWHIAALLACILPTVLFWGMRELNSSRHNFWIVIPLAVFVAAAVHHSHPGTPWKWAVVAALCLGNYFLGPSPAQESYRQATSHFFTAALDRKARVQRDQAEYRLLFLERGDKRKICIWPIGSARARAIATLIAHSDSCQATISNPDRHEWRLDLQVNGQPVHFWLPDAKDVQEIWPRICLERYDFYMPDEKSNAFFHQRGSPELLLMPSAPEIRR